MKRMLITAAIILIEMEGAKYYALAYAEGLTPDLAWAVGMLTDAFIVSFVVFILAWRHPGALGKAAATLERAIHGEAA